MLFQPSNVIPSMLTGYGLGVVHPSDRVHISWQINGNEPLRAFKYAIMRNNAASTSVYTSSKITISPAIYPTDAKGEPNFYTYDISTAWSALGVKAPSGGGYENGYKLKITQYYGANADQEVVQYAESPFICRVPASLSFVSAPNTVTTVKKTFSATFSQDDGDAVNAARWVFAHIGVNGAETVIEDTGNINTANLSYTVDGLLSGESYRIDLTVTTQNGESVSISKSFTVSYAQTDAPDNFSAKWLPDQSVLLRWGKSVNISGTASGSYSVAGGKLTLNSGATVTWNDVDGSAMSFSAPYSQAVKFSVSPFTPGTIENILGATAIDISSDGTKLAFATNNAVYLYSLTSSATFSQIGKYSDPSGITVKGLKFSADGTKLYAAGNFGDFGTAVSFTVGGSGLTFHRPFMNSGSVISETSRGLCLVEDRIFVYGDDLGSLKNGILFEDNGSQIGSISYITGVKINDAQYGNGKLLIATKYETRRGLRVYSVASNGTMTYSSSFGNATEYFAVAFSAGGKIAAANKWGEFYSVDIFASFGTDPVGTTDIGYTIPHDVCFIGENTVAIGTNNGLYIGSNNGLLGQLPGSGNAYCATNGNVLVYCDAQGVKGYLSGTSTLGNVAVFNASSNIVTVKKSGQKVTVTCGGNTVFDTFIPTDCDECTFGWNPGEFKLVFTKSNNISVVHEYTRSASYAQYSITSVVLHGGNVFDFVGVFMGSRSTRDLAHSDPTYAYDTYMLAPFSGNLEGGSVASASALVYRLDEGSSSLLPLYPVASVVGNQMKDYSVVSGKTYKYYLYFKSSDGETLYYPIVSEEFRRCFNYYTLTEASEDAENPNVYHALKTWKFRCNMGNISVSNNNNPEWLTNFTPYRLRQKTARMGRSGTLSGLIGDVRNGEYFDDYAEKAEELMRASVSNNAFFLRDPKGNIYMVSVSAPIVTSYDRKNPKLPLTFEIPFEEIGDARRVSVIQQQTDEGWATDAQILDVRLDVDTDSGILSQKTPNGYYGSEFGLEFSDLTATTPEGIEAAQIELDGGQVIATI